MKKRLLATGCLLAMTIGLGGRACAQTNAKTVAFALEPQDLDRALVEVGRATGREIIVAADAASGKRAPRLVGRLSADDAIRRLIAGTDLIAEFRDDVVLIRAAATAGAGAAATSDVVVTGTRIRGGVSASPLKVLSARQIRDAGQSDLGEVARSLPQNFNGGQNPEVGVGAPGDNQNLDAASSLNLRGLGGDATLTLLNGHRLAYDGAAQAIDISTIPLAAVERIEIVPDGASALYGSDAVGGVANVILKRDFRGFETSARIDVPTEGGGTEQQYNATAGTVWRGGGVLATYNFNQSDQITAGQRNITQRLAPTTTLLREQHHHSALVNFHQKVAHNVTFELDGLYSHRRSFGTTPFTLDGDSRDFGVESYSRTESYSIAPRLIVDLGEAWQATLQGVYARTNVAYESLYYSSGTVFLQFSGCACNRLATVEASAEGALFALPGGEARLAFGGGIRNAAYHYTRLGSADFDRERHTVFGYGELSLPLVSASNATTGLRQLSLSVAGRYEKYGGPSGVLSPKLGIVYAPSDGIDVKATWGRSFKAPTLNQQYSPSFFNLINASDLGFVTFPPPSTIAIVDGGSATLRPERARTWSATIDFHPVAAPGARFSIGYFNVDFTDRVQLPIDSLFGSLGNPIYAAFILASPSVTQVNDAIAATSAGLQNQTGRPFDPAEVVAIVDQRYRNVAREKASGVDVAASYTHQMEGGRSIAVTIDASHLTSSRVLIPGLSPVQLAGRIFYPPRFRGRGGLTWTSPRLTLAGYVNYVGEVDDRRAATPRSVSGQTTVDVALRARLAEQGWLSGTELALSVRNALNDLPSAINTGFAYATPYDSTNYSAVGRVIGVQLTRRF
ncbi:TonB-dependent receptor [Sphingomonas sp. SUN019]|uniref:TonB-dependent receptor n=1 Tax=Sphingomonas sp. SUN019 TaxID=2937788 RepID=UPI0021642F1F|nr:TonB-dependent receptor [Sphingomonas sp. SUN019]UVO50150.1 TonB-dependent receptor [Sphingomonas sp. SUN019]